MGSPTPLAASSPGRLSRPIAAFLLVLAALMGIGMLSAAPASATTTPTPTSTPTPPSDGITRTLSGTVTSEAGPLEGVTITVAGVDDPSFTAETETEANGRWQVQIPALGVYEVELDESTLPEGAELREGAANPVEVTAQSTSSNTSVVFRIGDAVVNTQGFGERLLIRLVAGLNFGLLIALAAVGLSLIFGTTGLTNFAHAEMVTLGAILAWFLSVPLGLNVVLAGVLAVVIAGGAGWGQDAGLWAPLRRRGLALVPMMIVSIGLSIAVRYTFQLFFGGSTRTLPVSQTATWSFGPITLAVSSYLSMILSVIALVGVALFLNRTRMGKATRAVADNSGLAAASGINVDRVIRLVWVMGGALAGLAGVMLGLYRQVSWDMGFQILLLVFAAVTLGGLGTAYGALVGSLIVGMFIELSTLWIPGDLRYVGALAILILVLLVRPQGILGRSERIG